MRTRTAAALIATSLLAGAPAAHAGEALLVVTAGAAPELVIVDSAAPGTALNRVPVAGLLVGESIAGIDLRPSTREVFAMTSANRMLAVDPLTGATRQVGAAVDPTFFAATPTAGFDFNPTVDRLRLVNAGNDNGRFNPVTFTPVDTDAIAAGVQGDTDVAFLPADPDAGQDPTIVASAYDRADSDPATATTLFAIDSGRNTLVRQGAIDGNAADVAGGGSPNGGLLRSLGVLGVDITDTAGFDTARPPAGETGWAALQPVGAVGSTLYSVNLAPDPAIGARATAVAPFGSDLVAGLTVLRDGLVRAAAAASGREGSTATITVERIGETLDPVTLDYTTVDGTAVGGQDYTPASGQLNFAKGERTKSVVVALTGDGVPEGRETFALDLTRRSQGVVVLRSTTVVEVTEPDTVKPVHLIAPRSPDTLRALRRAGQLRVDYSCSEACTVRTTLLVGSAPIGVRTVSRSSAGVGVVTVRLTTAGRRRLDRLIAASGGRVAVTVRSVATDSAGNSTIRKASLRLVRR